MKTVLTKFLTMSSIVLLMLSSCKKDEVKAVATKGTAGTLSASTTTPTLSKANIKDTTSVVRFTVTQPNFGYSAAVTNTLQIDAPGDNWAKPKSIPLSAGVSAQKYSTADFNALLLSLNLPLGVPSQVSVRVMHSISSSMAPIYSNVVNLTVTPFALTSFLYVAGAYEGWANPGPQEDSLLSATSNGIYTGIINFTPGNNQFLVLPAKNWTNKYATNDAQGTTSSTVKYNGPNNFYAPANAAATWVTIDINANTISFAPVATYYSVIGDAALGWGTDSDMKYNNGTQMWELTTTLKAGGGFKIRKNHDWGTSYGLLSTPDGVDLTSANGGNITVSTTGTYKITFGVNATDNTKATYTLTKQ